MGEDVGWPSWPAWPDSDVSGDPNVGGGIVTFLKINILCAWVSLTINTHERMIYMLYMG